MLRVLTLLLDRRVPTGAIKRSCLASLVDERLDGFALAVREQPGRSYAWTGGGAACPEP